MEEYNIVENTDKEFPLLLKELPEKDIPKKLYIKGILPPKNSLCIAIVGTRNPTPYGVYAAQEISELLAKKGIVIVSGMANGIDAVAHKACLKIGGKTIAVLGSGFNTEVIYPPENIDLAKKIVRYENCLLSEYAPNHRATKWTFPKRNRIIAGLSKAIIVIEAKERSGALITARLAIEYNRDLFALPGPIFDENSIGPNRLIKEGAMPITHPQDILDILDI